MGNRHAYLTCALSLSLIFNLCSDALSQEKKRPKLKDFGSSLKRARSDDQKKASGDRKSKAKANSDSDEIDVVKVETSLVTSDFLVLDPLGNLVSSLTEKDFVITEDGKPQSVGMLSQGDNIKISRSIVLIMDYSASELPYIKTSVAAAKALVDKLPESDSMAIVTDNVELIQNFTNNKKKLKDKLNTLLRGSLGRSQQYSALLATLNEAFNDEDQRPIVIFQTDGDQLGILRDLPPSWTAEQLATADKRAVEEWRKRIEAMRVNFSLEDICRAAEKARATIYTVIPGRRILGHSTDEQVAIAKMYLEDRKVQVGGRLNITNQRLKMLASGLAQQQAALVAVSASTGGWTKFLEKPEDADQIYSSILSDINRRYIVGYYPTNKEHDGKRRKIDVTIRDHPEYVVVGRRWYYAPAADW